MVEGLAEWRERHPKASLREIEGEVDRRIPALRAKMISDTANQGVSAEWAAADGIVCPECGAKLIKKGKQKRVLLTRDGRKIELARDYGVCVACGAAGIFPLDEELKLLPGKLRPREHESLVRLSAGCPPLSKRWN